MNELNNIMQTLASSDFFNRTSNGFFVSPDFASSSQRPTTGFKRSCQHPVGFLDPTRHRYQAGKENLFFRIAHRGLSKLCSISFLTEPFKRGGGGSEVQ